MVTVFSVDAYPFFLAFSDLTCHLEDTRIAVVLVCCSASGCTMRPDSKKTKLGISNQEATPSACKNTGVVLVPCWRMEVGPYSYFQWCGYS